MIDVTTGAYNDEDKDLEMELRRSINGLIVLTMLLSALLLTGLSAMPTRAATVVNYARILANIGAVTDVVSLTVPDGASPGRVASTYIHATLQTTPTWYIHLPLVMNHYPPFPDTPVLNPISSPGTDGSYTVCWNAAYLATTYMLHEDDNATFSSPTTQYSGPEICWSTSSQPAGTYYYRVKASNSWGDSEWSHTQSVTVPLPQSIVSVINDTGGQLCYEIYGTGIGQKCYSPGTYDYGAFPAGTYSWRASARCGSASGTQYYSSGLYQHRFWCSAGTALHAATLLLQSEE